MGFKPQTNPKCTSQPPKHQGKLDIWCQVQWETQGKTCGRWFSHPDPVENIYSGVVSCNISWRAQQP